MPDRPRSSPEICDNVAMLRHVAAWMRHLDVSQAEMAHRLDISEGSLSKWLSGRQAMTLSRFVALARALGLPSPFALGRPPGAEQNAHVADTPSEIELLRLWRDLPAGERERLVRIIEAFGASRQQDVA